MSAPIATAGNALIIVGLPQPHHHSFIRACSQIRGIASVVICTGDEPYPDPDELVAYHPIRMIDESPLPYHVRNKKTWEQPRRKNNYKAKRRKR